MTVPAGPPHRLHFTLWEIMALVAALGVLMAGAAIGYLVIPGLLAFLVVTLFVLRVFVASLPSLGSLLFGVGARRELPEEDVTRVRDWTRAAMSLCDACRYDEALDYLHAAESIRSGDVWNALAQAWCLRRLDRLDESTEPLVRTGIHTPFEPLLHYALACHWSLVGSAPRALDSLSMALELDPDLRECAVEEPDLDAIRGEMDYARLVEGAGTTL